MKAAYEGYHGPTGSFEAVRTLQVGAAQYVDRPVNTHSITSVPEALQGAHLIATINDDKQVWSQEYFVIDLYYNTTVYLAFDPRARRDNWLPSWVQEQFEETNLTVGVNDPDGFVSSTGMLLFKKEVTAGDSSCRATWHHRATRRVTLSLSCLAIRSWFRRALGRPKRGGPLYFAETYRKRGAVPMLHGCIWGRPFFATAGLAFRSLFLFGLVAEHVSKAVVHEFEDLVFRQGTVEYRHFVDDTVP